MFIVLLATIWQLLMDLFTILLDLCLIYSPSSKGYFTWKLGFQGINDSNQEKITYYLIRSVSLTLTHLYERCLCYKIILHRGFLFPNSRFHPIIYRQFLWKSTFSNILLIWIDILFGCLFGYYCLNNISNLMKFSNHCGVWMEEYFLLSSIEWFNHAPGGVKLNILITKNLSAILKEIIVTFGNLFRVPIILHKFIIVCISISGSMGLTIQLAIIIDVIRLLTVHIAVIHRFFCIIHDFQLNLLFSMWKLFQGNIVSYIYFILSF